MFAERDEFEPNPATILCMLIRTMSLVFAVFALMSSGCRAAKTPFDVPALQSAVESIAERAKPRRVPINASDRGQTTIEAESQEMAGSSA